MERRLLWQINARRRAKAFLPDFKVFLGNAIVALLLFAVTLIGLPILACIL